MTRHYFSQSARLIAQQPDLDGYEVARRLRQNLGRSVRLIALTGYGRPEDEQRARDAGFDAHVTKPVDSESWVVFSRPEAG